MLTTEQTTERAHLNAWVHPRDRDRLIALARSNERSLSAELRLAIRAHVEQHEPEGEES